MYDCNNCINVIIKLAVFCVCSTTGQLTPPQGRLRDTNKISFGAQKKEMREGKEELKLHLVFPLNSLIHYLGLGYEDRSFRKKGLTSVSAATFSRFSRRTPWCSQAI